MAERQSFLSALSDLKKLFGQWSSIQKAFLGGVLILIVAIFFFVLQSVIDEEEYRLLYANLDAGDVAAVSDYLRYLNEDFQEGPRQGSIYVAGDRVHQLRLELAGRALPSVNGSEVAGERGQTFVESLTGADPRLVVQRELSRTLAALDNIHAARVHLEFSPGQAATVSQPGATVLLSLAPGRALTKPQLQTVLHVISASVPGLESRNVRVLDSSGALLSGDSLSGEAILYPDSSLSYQASLERSLERKVQDLADAMFGKGRTMIRITATLDFSRTETTSERYDPDEAVVRSEHIERQPLGDTASDLLPGQTAAPRSRSSVTTSSKVDYEISKTTSRSFGTAGQLQQLAVTILVADTQTIADDGTVSRQPPSSADLEAIRSLVAGALPLKPERGDIIHLRSMPAGIEAPSAPQSISPLVEIITALPLGKLFLVVFSFVLFYWLLLRPVMAFLYSEMERTRSDDTATVHIAGAESATEATQEDIAVQLSKEVKDKPLAAAHIIKKWMQEA